MAYGGEGGRPPPKKLGGFYGLTSHGFDQGERRKGTLYETKQKRRKKEMKETKKRGKKRNDIFFFFSQVNDFYQLSIEVKILRQIEIKDRNSLNSVLQLGTCRCIVL